MLLKKWKNNFKNSLSYSIEFLEDKEKTESLEIIKQLKFILKKKKEIQT